MVCDGRTHCEPIETRWIVDGLPGASGPRLAERVMFGEGKH
jgi:hypothetical protein